MINNKTNINKVRSFVVHIKHVGHFMVSCECLRDTTNNDSIIIQQLRQLFFIVNNFKMAMNTKQIRTLVVIGLVIVIGGSIVLFYGKTLLPTQSEETSSLTTLDTTDKSINSVGDENADKNRAANEESTAVTPKTAQEDAALRARALEIINKPVVTKAAVSPESQKQAEEKIAAAKKLIQENYDYDLPWLELAAYRQVLGDFDGAIKALDFLGTIRPKGYVSFHNLGVIYGFYLKNYPKSEENFLKSIENNSTNFDAYSQLITVYEAYKPEKAESLLMSAIKQYPSNASFKIMLGQYYAKIGKKAEAIQYLEEALKLNPANTELKAEIEELKNFELNSPSP